MKAEEAGKKMDKEIIELPRPNQTIHHTGCMSRVYNLKNEKTLHAIAGYPRPWDPRNPHKVNKFSFLHCFFEGNNSHQIHLRLEQENILAGFDVTFSDAPFCESKRSFSVKSKDLMPILNLLDSWY